MSESLPKRAAPIQEFGVEAFGVRIALGASDAELLERVAEITPPGSKPCPCASADKCFALVAERPAGYRILGAPAELTSPELELALGLLDSIVRTHVALQAVDRVFVHAGVVAYGGRAILIPGPSFSGKTTLVAALVRAGAAYYSDDYAVLDEHGFVHPYAKPLSIRGGDLVATDHRVEDLGGYPGNAPTPVELIALTSYRPGAAWAPVRRTTGRGMLALLENAVVGWERPTEVLAAARAAAAKTTVLEGERGEAEEVSAALLETLSNGRHTSPTQP